MRILALTALTLLLTASAVGCSSGDDDGQETSRGLTPVPSRSSTSATTPSATSKVPSAAPKAGASISAVTTWVRAGAPADEAEFRTATRDDVTTQLGEYVAFVTPSGKTRCMTGELSDGALACLVTLADPPPQPDEVYGEWVPGWVEFDGTEVTMGAGRADPGQFSAGTGAELPYGSTLKFGDYQCRSDQAGVFCINFAHQSGVRISDTGVEPFGCLRKDDTPPDAAARYSCR